VVREPGHAVGDEPVRGPGDRQRVDGLHGLKPQGRAVAEGEPVRDLGRRLGLDGRLKQPAGGAAAAAEAVAEAGAGADPVHEHGVLGDEGPAAAAGDDQVLGGERGDGLAHGVPVDAEALGELALGGQPRAGGLPAADDLPA
jgi:hypothetical protein